ncbi:MAG: thioredoxin family protein [Candidatus Riflebacteria bacterium]|nr:thioredoxin family protein [Candidatus Riflebacteria bacterium]
MEAIETIDDFTRNIKEHKIVLSFFYAGWCRPSERQFSIVEKLSSEYSEKIRFISVDADKADALCDRYNVKTLPELIFFGEGEIIEALLGFQQEAYIREYIDFLAKQAVEATQEGKK